MLCSLISVVSRGGHSKGSLTAIVDLIACSSVCACTLGMNELLGLLPVGGPWLAKGSLLLCGSLKFNSAPGTPSIGRYSIESKSISMSV